MSRRDREFAVKDVVCATVDPISSLWWKHLASLKLRPLVIAVTLSGASFAMGQRSAPPPKGQNPTTTPRPGITQEADWPLLVNSDSDNSPEHQHMKQRNAARGKMLLEKAARLLQLSDELKEDVAKLDGDMPSGNLVRKSEQIEKLAKSIHELVAPQ